jgi:hypothetical protein|tara:strand:+ start:202 stop:465 length:264 start_codon:yes stop_codon:yes gene_type:complete
MGDSMTILESIYSGDKQNYNGTARINKQRKATYAWDTTDANIFICPECDIAWQRPISGGQAETYNYYEDFPTIGKKRKVCPKCTKKK